MRNSIKLFGILALSTIVIFAFSACSNPSVGGDHTHSYNWTITTPATPWSEGVETGTCSCSVIQKRQIPKIIPDVTINLEAASFTEIVTGVTNDSASPNISVSPGADKIVLIKGDTGSVERAISIYNATNIYIADNTIIKTESLQALLVPAKSTITGGGDNIIIMNQTSFAGQIYAIYSNGDITILGTLGDITGYSNGSGCGIHTGGALSICGTIGNISGGTNGIESSGAITISGTIGNVINNSTNYPYGIKSNKDIIISGTIGNIDAVITSSRSYGIDSGGVLKISGTVGNISASMLGINSTGDLMISGSIGDITLGGYSDNNRNGIYSGGNLTISGTIGNINSTGVRGAFGIGSNNQTVISGSIGNINVTGSLGAVGIASGAVSITGIIGDITVMSTTSGGYVTQGIRSDGDVIISGTIGNISASGNSLNFVYGIQAGSKVEITEKGIIGDNTASSVSATTAQIRVGSNDYNGGTGFPKPTPKPWVW